MSKLVELLERAPLRAPSEDLSRRVERAFREAESASRRWHRLPVPLWASLAAALVCGIAGFVLRGREAPPPAKVVYFIPLEGELKRILMGETRRREPPMKVEVRVNGRLQEGL